MAIGKIPFKSKIHRTLRYALYCLFGVLFSTEYTFAQKKYSTQYVVQYEVQFSPDTTNLSHKINEEMYLYTGNSFGFFSNNDVIALEKKLEAARRRSGNSASVSYDFSNDSEDLNFTKSFYKDHAAQKVITIGKLMDKKYKFSEPEIPLTWEIQDSTKIISKYPVQKATTRFAGRDYIAWFTPEIPIPDGPYVFAGLPGLIVELYDTHKEYSFSMLSLEKLEKPKEWEIPETKKIKKFRYKTLAEKVRRNAENTADIEQMIDHYHGDIGISMRYSSNGKLENLDFFSSNMEKVSKQDFIKSYKTYIQTHNNTIEQ